MKKLVALSILTLVVALVATGAFASYKPGGYIAGSKHDFRTSTTYPNLAATLTPGYASELGADFVPAGEEICRACHVPHNAIGGYRLWAKDYTDGSGLSATVGNPPVNSPSTLCMQCHDGTIALGPVSDGISNAANLGTDLTDDHPVDVACNWAAVKVDAATPTSHGPYITIYGTQVVAEPSSHNQGSLPIDLVYSISSDGTTGTGYITCSSCHNVHGMNKVDDATGARLKIAKFLVMENTGSALCQACHGK